MIHLLRRRTQAAGHDGEPAEPDALANDLCLLFSTRANPLGRPPACDWARAPAGWAAATAAGRRKGRQQLAGGLIAGLAAVVLTAAGYATVTGTGLADRMFANFGPTAEWSGVHPLGVSQTIEGVTITVEHVVFDGQPVEELSGPNGPMVSYVPVMVQFTVSGIPAGGRQSVNETVTSGGQLLRRAGAVGLGGGAYSDLLQRGLPADTQQLLVAYDTTGLRLESGTLALRLEVTVTPGDGPSGQPIRFGIEFEVPTK